MSINIKCLLKSKCDKLSCTFSFKESHSLVEMYIPNLLYWTQEKLYGSDMILTVKLIFVGLATNPMMAESEIIYSLH